MAEDREQSPGTEIPWLRERRGIAFRRRWNIPSTRAAINRAVHEVVGEAARYGCVSDCAADVEIALREALANAVIHGNRGEPNKRVSLRVYVHPKHGMFIAVRDEGEGFDPAAIPDPRSRDRIELPHGRGIFLMHELMDHATHRKGGREVVLWKEIRR